MSKERTSAGETHLVGTVENRELGSAANTLSTTEHRNVAQTVEILRSFEQLKAAGLSSSEIADSMNAKGLEPPGGGVWNETVVRRIEELLNEPFQPRQTPPPVPAASRPEPLITPTREHEPPLQPHTQPQPRTQPQPQRPSRLGSGFESDFESGFESKPYSGFEPRPRTQSGTGSSWAGPKGIGLLIIALTVLLAGAFVVVAINERRNDQQTASADGTTLGAKAITSAPAADQPTSADDSVIPTVPTVPEGEEPPDPGDMMAIRVEPEDANPDVDGAVPAATATVKADGLLHLEGAFPSQTEAEGYIDGLAKVFGRENIVESYTIDPAAPLPTVSDVGLDKPVLFETGTANIDPSYIPFLEACGDVLKLNPQITMSISAFTDSTGDDQLNLELSQQRAQAIYDFYRDLEIDQSQLVSTGYGEASPVADNDTEEGRRQNRRAMLQLLGVIAEESSG